jgi:hypothetical protein
LGGDAKMHQRVFLLIGGEKVVGRLTHTNINDLTLYIAVLEQKPTFPSYRNFEVGDYVVVRNNRSQFVVLRKIDKPINQLSSEWKVIA